MALILVEWSGPVLRVGGTRKVSLALSHSRMHSAHIPNECEEGNDD